MTADIFSLREKKVIVTGATGGIGSACARAVAAYGADTVLVGRNHDKLIHVQNTVDTVKSESARTRIHALSFHNLPELRAFFLEHRDAAVLINSVGINIPKSILDISENDYDTLMNANLKSAFFQTRYFTEAKTHPKTGDSSASIIHISSQMGHVGGENRSIYCASKHALEGLCKAAALELGQWNIRINTICPTFIDTPLSRKTLEDPARKKMITDSIVFNRLGTLEDLYGAVVYLASDSSSLVTGGALKVDGGWTAH